MDTKFVKKEFASIADTSYGEQVETIKMENNDWKVESRTTSAYTDTDIENRICEEIEWGISYRKNRNQEKQLDLATSDSLELPAGKRQKRAKKCKKRRRPRCEPLTPVISQRILFNRDTCTQQQYYNMLSRPRPNVQPPAAAPMNRGTTSCSPRYEQLALPTKQRVLNTWQDYEDVLAPENILWLKSLLTRDECLAPKAAEKYFKKLDVKKRKARRKRLKKQRERSVKKPHQTKVVAEIEGLARDIVCFFADKMTLTVKHRHMMITELIKAHLVAHCLIRPCKRNKGCVADETLHAVLDQLSVWLETNVVCPVDEDLEQEEEAGPSVPASTASTYTSTTEEADELLRISDQMETISAITLHSSVDALAEVESIIGEISELGGSVIYIADEPELTGQSAAEQEEEAGAGEGVEAGVEDIAEEETAIGTGGEGIDDEAAMIAGEEEVEEDAGLVEEEEEEEEDAGLVEAEREDMAAIEEEEPGEGGLEQDLEISELDDRLGGAEELAFGEGIEEEELAPEEPVTVAAELAAEALDVVRGLLDELIDSIETESRALVPAADGKLHVEEHSPDTICCVAMKKYAIWMSEVARNTYRWCQWIQNVISKLRFFAAVLKGQVKTPEGKLRILYKEEWTGFKDTMDTDITTWVDYNTHVKDMSENIIANFEHKRVVCCPACLQEHMIVTEETAHEVGEQLAEAIQKTAYWRNWLEQMMNQARQLTALQNEFPPAPEDYSTTDASLASYSSFDLIEIKSPVTVTVAATAAPATAAPPQVERVESSDMSLYIIEEFQ